MLVSAIYMRKPKSPSSKSLCVSNLIEPSVYQLLRREKNCHRHYTCFAVIKGSKVNHSAGEFLFFSIIDSGFSTFNMSYANYHIPFTNYAQPPLSIRIKQVSKLLC